MILANLVKAIREQNYYAVVLEFLIVIAGVVIGFQIQAWNQTRAIAQEEYNSLVRLQDESEVILEFWTEEVRREREFNKDRRFALEALTLGTLAEDDQERFELGLFTMGFYPTFNPPSDVYNELISSGGLAKISDLAAREAVAVYVRELTYITGQLVQFRPTTEWLEEAAKGLIYYTYNPDLFTLMEADFNFEDLAGDREYVSAQVTGVRNQIIFFRYRQNTLAAALDMCREVSRAVEMTCEGVVAAQAEVDMPLWSEPGNE